MLLWVTFAAAIVAIVAGTVVAVVRGVRLWRAVRHTGSRLREELERIDASAAEIQGHLDAAEAGVEHLSETAERLRRSRARLEVQLQALREARTVLRRTVDSLP
jgi:predicted nuclease with TOPRIM domain